MSKFKCEVAYLTCDSCGKKAEVNVTTEETELPVGWLAVEVLVNHRDNDACHHSDRDVDHFCCKACCLSKMIDKFKEATHV